MQNCKEERHSGESWWQHISCSAYLWCLWAGWYSGKDLSAKSATAPLSSVNFVSPLPPRLLSSWRILNDDHKGSSSTAWLSSLFQHFTGVFHPFILCTSGTVDYLQKNGREKGFHRHINQSSQPLREEQLPPWVSTVSLRITLSLILRKSEKVWPGAERLTRPPQEKFYDETFTLSSSSKWRRCLFGTQSKG